MSEHIEVVFQGLSRSEATASYVEDRFQHLKERYPRVGGARMTVKLPHKHSQKGSGFELHLEVHVPGAASVNVTAAGEAHGETGLDPVVNDAFRAASAQLEHRFGKQGRVA